jgi:CheY-like chemotaxis protein
MPSDAAVVHVVDDDEAMRQSMAFLLRTANIQVQTYEAAADFLNALSQAKAGCVVTDVRMPGDERDRTAATLAKPEGLNAGHRDHRSRRCAARCRSHEGWSNGFHREAIR